jgi:hypothetical protein
MWAYWRKNSLLIRSICAGASAFIILSGSPVVAQYEYDPLNADEIGRKDIRVFGVVKDDRGRFVEGATVLVDQVTLIQVQTTSVSGRYTVSLPIEISPDQIKVSCSKPGYDFVRLTRLAGGADKKKWVEVNCFLRPSA